MNSLVHIEEGSPPRFIAKRCENCSLLVFPARRRCARCLSESFRDELVEPDGELYSYSVVHMGRPGVVTPYAIGVADFPENIRVMAKVDGWEDGMEIGQLVRAADATEEPRNDNDLGNIRLELVSGSDQ
jgi:uncharacterized OB-fold protein